MRFAMRRTVPLTSAILWISFILPESHKVTPANIYVWPLGTGIFNNEVIQHGQQGSIGDVTFAPGPAVLGYQAFTFKGSAASYTDLRIPMNVGLTGDMTIMFYIYLESITNGVLFHFQSDDINANDAVTGIDVTLDSNYVIFKFTGNAGTWSIGGDRVVHLLTTGQWHHIAVERDISNSAIKLYIDDDSTDIAGCPKSVPFGFPGTLRLGYSNTSNSFLNGRIACLIIQDDKYDNDKLSTDILDCDSSAWTTTAAPCPADCHSYRGYFLLTQRKKVPQSFIPRLDSATNFTSRRCADMCLAKSNCVSFVTQNATGYCEIFYGDHTTYMEDSSADTNYYVRRDKCCM